MGVVWKVIKVAAKVGAVVACPAAAGPILLADVAYKTAKAATDEDDRNAARHVASIASSFIGAEVGQALHKD
jgi:hypothetical protein